MADLDFLRDEISKFKDRFDEDVWTKIESLRIAMKESVQIKGRAVKEALSPHTRNWVNLYHQVHQAIEILRTGRVPSPERIAEIGALWESLRDRIQRPDYALLKQSPYAELLQEVLMMLRLKNFFVLSRGELEDYFTSKALHLSQGKDARALAVGAELLKCSDLEEASEWVIIDEFMELLQMIGSWASIE